MRTLFLTLATLATATPAHADLQQEVETAVSVCLVTHEDPAAEYTVKVGSTTVYEGDSLTSALDAVGTRLTTAMADLSLTLNADGRSALIAAHNCMRTHDLEIIHGAVVWANTLGGFGLTTHDRDDEDGNTYTLDSVRPSYWHHDLTVTPATRSEVALPVFYFREDGSTGTRCDNSVVGGWIFGGSPVVVVTERWVPLTDAEWDLFGASCVKTGYCGAGCYRNTATTGGHPPDKNGKTTRTGNACTCGEGYGGGVPESVCETGTRSMRHDKIWLGGSTPPFGGVF